LFICDAVAEQRKARSDVEKRFVQRQAFDDRCELVKDAEDLA
jgi:hypothetical protein